MTAQTSAITHGVPSDTLSVRLAIVRSVTGWTADQAGRAVGVSGQAWRNWETGASRCTDLIGVARKIEAATGISWQWVAMGGPLAGAA